MRRGLTWLLAVSALAPLRAQSGGGQAEIAAQGYYLKGGSQTTSTSGMVVKFNQFIPDFGLLRANLEAYRSEGGIHPADNFLELRGFIWMGLRWNFHGGDFRASGTLLQNPFTNLFFPEIQARGVHVEAGDDRQGMSFYYGMETLLAGPRIPFRIDVPQKVLGATARRKFGNLETGIRLLRLETLAHDASQNIYFPPGRDFQSTDNLTLYSGYTFNDHFRLYGEATGARALTTDGQSAGDPFSFIFGPAWESPRLTVRMNYSSLTQTYMPIAGYWTGDRRGPFGEIRVRPFHGVEVFGSASQYETTTSQTAQPYFRSTGTSAGVSFDLPWKLYANAQMSTTNFYSSDPSTQLAQHSYSEQWNGSFSRRFGLHNLRFTGREMKFIINGVPSDQKSIEMEDLFQLRHFVFGAGVRGQLSGGTENRNSVYLHGSAQINMGRFSAFGYYEGGKDLANQTIFATNNTSSTVVNASLSLTQHWSIQAEAFRTKLLSSINPESQFLQGNPTLALNPVLNQFDQWSFLVRVAHTFNWGNGLPNSGLDRYTMQQIPITGALEGFVTVLMAGGKQPAPGVSVVLESGRSALTDSTGKYRLEDVPEGPHTVGLDMEQLPADYNPGPESKGSAVVGPRKVARVDLSVYALSSFTGKVAVRPGSSFETLEGILIRAEPGGQYTTTLKDGSFAFYNLPDGDYQVSLVQETLPPDALLKSEPALPIQVQTGAPPTALQFEIERRPEEPKPVRRVLEQQIIRKTGPGQFDK